MAAPVVTGLVANLLADNRNLTLPQVLELLKKASTIPGTSSHQPPAASGPKPYGREWGYGLIDAGKLK
jgi:hypothetical protein